MKLQIISPQKVKNYLIAWLEVETSLGNYVIQPGHAPTILILAENQQILFRLKTGKQEAVVVRRGILEIDRQKTTVIMNEEV